MIYLVSVHPEDYKAQEGRHQDLRCKPQSQLGAQPPGNRRRKEESGGGRNRQKNRGWMRGRVALMTSRVPASQRLRNSVKAWHRGELCLLEVRGGPRRVCSWGTVTFSLAACLQHQSCDACVSSDLTFNCSWCHVLQRFVPRLRPTGGLWRWGRGWPGPDSLPHCHHESISSQSTVPPGTRMSQK